MDPSTPDLAVFWTVVLARFLLPLLIPAFPLPAILACFAVDAMDMGLFQRFTHLDLAGYQSYDKALDVFYLSVAMLATLRNWTSYPAVRMGRILFYYRLIGVMAFELSSWRPLLVLFPNTFEYFFIFYELMRSRWSPARLSSRQLAVAVAGIWILIKLPQEYWIHIARLDLSDSLKRTVLGASAETGWVQAIGQRPIAFVLLAVLSAGCIAALGILIRRLAGPPKHPLTLAAGPLPEFIDEAQERDRNIALRWRLFDAHLVEKIGLVGIVTVIFAQVLPSVGASPVKMVVAVGVIVTINTFLRLRSARAGRSVESALLSFFLLAVTNIAIVAVADRLLRGKEEELNVLAALIFLLLLTLIVTLYDRWRPVFEARFMARRGRPTPQT